MPPKEKRTAKKMRKKTLEENEELFTSLLEDPDGHL